ncbi:MAG: anti-sigma factor family protein [Candidatus Acidiferrales bacterium]
MTETSCQEVCRALPDYADGEMEADLRTRVEAHLKVCPRCKSIYDGTKNIAKLVAKCLSTRCPRDSTSVCTTRSKISRSAASIARPDFVSKASSLSFNPETFHR